MNTAERASAVNLLPSTVLTLAGTIPSTYCSILPTYPHSEPCYRLQLFSDEDNYRLVTPTEHHGTCCNQDQVPPSRIIG